jgi:hypothetical protein
MSDDLQERDLEESLRRAGVFHPEDLEANRAGQLSEAQKRWLALEAAFWFGLAGLETGLVIAIWVFFWLHPSGSLLIIALSWGVVLILLSISCVQDGRLILAERQDGRVEALAGTLSKHFSMGRSRWYGSTGCSIEIRGHLFDVSPSTYDAIVEHRSYQLFYTPKNRTLVNIVPLSALDEKRRSALASLQQA